ncbi:hypothetical protein PROFUN_06116 [Planoprotostelium fungivorum]|uniref:Uncharacterized protein n=1 Tax=Planoprotostelium fungivorum TaxID=1890364 RepID=A0A2P6NPG5_9EUKA|nr:hypothetical protein PROFUN_06116 [Planoprotostelium fungivorum]
MKTETSNWRNIVPVTEQVARRVAQIFGGVQRTPTVIDAYIIDINKL